MQPNPSLNRRSNILMLILSSIGILGLLIRSAYLTITGFSSFDPDSGSSQAASLLSVLGMLFCAGLLLPVLVYTVKRLKGQEILLLTIPPVKVWQVAVLFATWVLVVVIGTVLARLFVYGWAGAALLFLLGISLPILSMVWISTGGLPGGSRQRLWSVFGFGMLGATVLAMLLEFMVIGMAALVIGVVVVAHPELRSVIDQIKTLVTNASTGNMEALLTVLAPYISNPLVILSILVFAAVLAPLIEEAIKPAVIWFLGKHLGSPAEGFGLGALCGAGFALLEGLMAASSLSQMWGFGLAGRAAASLMHITSSGIMGWAIASAQLEKRYGRLALIYLLAVSIHGLWNGSVIMVVYGALRVMIQNMEIDVLGGSFAMGGLGILFLEFVLLLTALPLINYRLRQSNAHQSLR